MEKVDGGRQMTGVKLASNDADVHCPLPATALIGLDVELELLPFLEGVKLAPGQGGMMEKDFAAVLGADECETTVTNDSDDWPLSHEYTPRAQSSQHPMC
jgi:hypothetical protein